MTPVDTFLRSVRTAFQPGEGIPTWIWPCIALAVPLAIALRRWSVLHARRRQDETAFARLLTAQGLSTADGAVLLQLASRSSQPPLDVATRLDAFERATARALAGQPLPATAPPTPDGREATVSADDNDVFARVHRLRRALGFHVVPDHVPLSTTREFVPGMRVKLDDVPAIVVEVNEAWFAVEATDAALKPRAPGTTAFVTFTRGHDARYVAHCALVSQETIGAVGSFRKRFLLHDEKPQRHQLRAAVRVNAQGAVTLLPREAAPTKVNRPTPAAVEGTLIDISVGGFAAEAPVALAAGTALHASITWAGESYRELPAAVLKCDARGVRFHLRLEFRGLSTDDDARLSAAIARHSGRLPGAT
jgi:choline dehydrogenase-like flavoprotein